MFNVSRRLNRALQTPHTKFRTLCFVTCFCSSPCVKNNSEQWGHGIMYTHSLPSQITGKRLCMRPDMADLWLAYGVCKIVYRPASRRLKK